MYNDRYPLFQYHAENSFTALTILFALFIPPLPILNNHWIFFTVSISSVQLLSRVRLFATPWIAARQASPSITNSWSSFKLMSIVSVMPSKHLIFWGPLLLPLSVFPSIRVFSSHESVLHIRCPNYWNFSFNISPCNEYSGLISLRMDLLDLLAVQGTLKSLLQHLTNY